MKILPLSDLHLETGNRVNTIMPDEVPDVYVLAGDIHNGTQAFGHLIPALLKKAHVIYVAGNHEFYGHNFPENYDHLREAAAKTNQESHPFQVHFLNNDIAVINGIQFIGATLWTDYDHGSEFTMKLAEKHMRDHFVIKRDSGGRFLPEDAYNAFKTSLDYIKLMLGQPFSGKQVVVTHHTPSHQSTAAEFANDLLNGAFHSDLDYIIQEYEPELWIHGHTHYAFDYVIDNTRVVCNPYGYPHESNIRRGGWVKNKIVEV